MTQTPGHVLVVPLGPGRPALVAGQLPRGWTFLGSRGQERCGLCTQPDLPFVAERVVPYFTQNPQSYLILPTMKDAYKTFAIEITFRPDTPDGKRR